MSYATSLLAAYPSSYGASTLFSDNLVQRSSFDNVYHPPVGGYGGTDRLFSDDFAFNHNQTTYHPPLYSISNPTSVFPTQNYENSPVGSYRHQPLPSNDSYALLNDIPEYSESLVTASNTNTASSIARSLHENKTNLPINKFPNQPPNYTHTSNDGHGNQPMKSVWSSTKTKTKTKGGQLDDTKKKPLLKQQPGLITGHTQPSTGTQKDSTTDKLNDDLTPVQSPHLPQPPTIDIQEWVNRTKKESPTEDKDAEQAWTVKIDHLHMVQAQHEREKTKSVRPLPNAPKKSENKTAVVNKKKPAVDVKPHDSKYQHESYFDTLFDGDYFRKPSTNNYSISSSFQNGKSTINKLANSLNNINSTVTSKNPKQVLQQKKPRYEPPTSKRVPPTITTTSWRKTWPKQYHFDSIYPYHLFNEFTHREFVHKDTDERFREALHKLRADRAEQQNKEINEKTAKRLNYGDYVRHSTKDALLHNVIKPSPWSDFMDLKKGNLYSLSQEEKKELYHQSKSYGERIRYRNFGYNYGSETARSFRHSAPLTDDDSQGSESGDAAPHPRLNHSDSKSVSRTSRRLGSASTSNKTSTKPIGARGLNRPIPNQASRTTVRTDRSNANRQSENDDEDISGYDANRKYKQKTKKKNVHYAKGDPSGRSVISGDENDNDTSTYGQRTHRATNRDADDDLFTVREEKTLESFEGARYKKR
ncbi:unnamed protein product [Rotaria socialis]|uniref:Uncharacterized protein n=2 Tax=Rotaria socialis TaxID=392032 RepID=A0A817X6I1_9BILA|nr:unnamed protein product [Rotaria socialis]